MVLFQIILPLTTCHLGRYYSIDSDPDLQLILNVVLRSTHYTTAFLALPYEQSANQY